MLWEDRAITLAFQRRRDDVGGAVAESALQLQHDLAGAITLEPFVGNGGACDLAAQAFERLALTGATAHRRMQAEAVRQDAAFEKGIELVFDKLRQALDNNAVAA